MIDFSWVAIDWGTTNFRLWLIDQEGGIVMKKYLNKSALNIQSGGHEQFLLDIIPQLRKKQSTKIVACGMIGAKQGWHEVAYKSVPFDLFKIKPVTITTKYENLAVYITPGLKQTHPADVIRGEETQILGLLATKQLAKEMLLCMPGTHTKWVKLKASLVLEFKTFMSGEMFSLLNQHSTLKNALLNDDAVDTVNFNRGFSLGFNQPADFLNLIFLLRATYLLDKSNRQINDSYLTGILLGLELASINKWIKKNDWPLYLIGSGGFTKAYQLGLDILQIKYYLLDADTLSLKGLISIHDKMK